jgi:hypothetical protein
MNLERSVAASRAEGVPSIFGVNSKPIGSRALASAASESGEVAP